MKMFLLIYLYMFIRFFIRKYILLGVAMLLFFSVDSVFAAAQQPFFSLELDLLKTYPLETYLVPSIYNQVLLDNFAASTQKIQLEKEVPVRNLSTLIGAYCASILSPGKLFDGEFMYSPQQSAFVYLLCSNVQADFAKFYDTPSTFT